MGGSGRRPAVTQLTGFQRRWLPAMESHEKPTVAYRQATDVEVRLLPELVDDRANGRFLVVGGHDQRDRSIAEHERRQGYIAAMRVRPATFRLTEAEYAEINKFLAAHPAP